MMVSDEEIVMRIITALQNADLSTTTTAAIRRQLEEDLGTDLSDKKAFIREQVDLYLQAQQQQQQQHQHHLYLQSQQQYLHSLQQQQQHQHQHQHQQQQQQQHQHQHQHQPFLPPHYYPSSFPPPHVMEDNGDTDEEEIAVQPEPEPKRLAQSKSKKSEKDGQPKEKKKRTGGGLNKTCGVSPELRALIGDKELTRTQVVKELWAYIRENNLQDPENRRKIVCNDELRSLLGCDSTDMFKMNKLLARHIFTLENTGADGEEPKPKRPKKEGSENEEGKSRVSGFTAPHPISEALINFLGTGESELSRSEVTKRIWEYIKGNQLQDPADKRQILCDSKLQELFGCDSFHGFGMAKYLSPHFIKG